GVGADRGARGGGDARGGRGGGAHVAGREERAEGRLLKVVLRRRDGGRGDAVAGGVVLRQTGVHRQRGAVHEANVRAEIRVGLDAGEEQHRRQIVAADVRYGLAVRSDHARRERTAGDADGGRGGRARRFDCDRAGAVGEAEE